MTPILPKLCVVSGKSGLGYESPPRSASAEMGGLERLDRKCCVALGWARNPRG